MKKTGIIICLIAITTISGMAQEVINKADKTKKGKSTFVEIKEDSKPLIIIDGKEYDTSILDIIDKDKIESVAVYKGERARELYDTTSVIIISMKKTLKITIEEADDTKKENSTIKTRNRVKVDISSDENSPLIVIDGVVVSKEELDNISPDSIESIEVLKDEKSMKKYKTENGVILIKMKKKEDKIN